MITLLKNIINKLDNFIDEFTLLNDNKVKDIAVDVDTLDDSKPILLVIGDDLSETLGQDNFCIKKVESLGRPNQLLLYSTTNLLMKSLNLKDLSNLVNYLKNKYKDLTDIVLVRDSLYSYGDFAETDPTIDLISEETHDFNAVEIISFCDICPSVNVSSNSKLHGDSLW